MRQCLTHPEGGYYTRQTSTGQDQFGTKGDFVTSPEISQVFGELIGIWLYAEWLAQGRKDKVQIIEVGPGRGTLMDDVLRVWCSPNSREREAYSQDGRPYLVSRLSHIASRLFISSKHHLTCRNSKQSCCLALTI